MKVYTVRSEFALQAIIPGTIVGYIFMSDTRDDIKNYLKLYLPAGNTHSGEVYILGVCDVEHWEQVSETIETVFKEPIELSDWSFQVYQEFVINAKGPAR